MIPAYIYKNLSNYVHRQCKASGNSGNRNLVLIFFFFFIKAFSKLQLDDMALGAPFGILNKHFCGTLPLIQCTYSLQTFLFFRIQILDKIFKTRAVVYLHMILK